MNRNRFWLYLTIPGLDASHPERNRVVYGFALFVVIMVGLPTRLLPEYMPLFMVKYGGDTLWAAAIFLIFGLLFPRGRTSTLALLAFVLTWGVECSQLYQAAWINALRGTAAGGLLLGHAFLWSDLVCYSLGIALGLALDKLISRQLTKGQ